MSHDTLGRYRLLKELGRGAMGRVFLAHDPEIDRHVALKTIQLLDALPQAEREETRARVLREARAAGKLLHPGIVTLFDVGEADGMLYLAMEHVEGQTLDAFCRPDTLLPPETVVEIVAGIAEALEYAHHMGVVHRDIKPANLMRVEEVSAKIMDFGLARAAEAQVTQDGTLFGTPSYMSPEQIRGEALDGRSDLFSLGVVLFELLTGEKPFPGDSVSSILYRIVHEPLRDIAEARVELPAPFGAFLKRALAKDREQRFPQGGAFAAALREATQRPAAPAAEARPEVPAAPLPPRRSLRRAKRRRVLPLLALVLLAAAGGAGWYFRDRLPLELLETLVPEPEPVWLEATVRTEPPGLPVAVDGEPLADESGVVRFQAGGPPLTLSTRQGCRTVEQPLSEADAGGEIVLLVESETFDGPFDPGVAGAEVRLNGERVGTAPVELELDLCRENTVTVAADGYQDATVTLPALARPIDVRTALAAVELATVPRGTLRLPETSVPLVFYVDGERVARDRREIELTEGSHRLRFKNDALWIDERRSFEVTAGQAATPSLDVPAVTNLVVQAFPANCKVFLRKPGGTWKHVDDTPAELRLATGTYEVRVQLIATGQRQDRTVTLKAGTNPPLRVSFGAGS